MYQLYTGYFNAKYISVQFFDEQYVSFVDLLELVSSEHPRPLSYAPNNKMCCKLLSLRTKELFNLLCSVAKLERCPTSVLGGERISSSLHDPSGWTRGNVAYNAKNAENLVSWFSRKIIKIVTTRCEILRLKCTKWFVGLSSAPDPAGELIQHSPDTLAQF